MLSDIMRTRRVYSTMRRLFNNLKQAVSLDPPPECPITLDVIEPENVCILSCCTTFIDKQSVAQLVNKRCPMCRQPITGLASVQDAVSTLAPKEAAKPAAEEEDDDRARCSTMVPRKYEKSGWLAQCGSGETVSERFRVERVNFRCLRCHAPN